MKTKKQETFVIFQTLEPCEGVLGAISSFNLKSGNFTISEETDDFVIFDNIINARKIRTRLANLTGKYFRIETFENMETFWTWNGCFCTHENNEVYKANIRRTLVTYLHIKSKKDLKYFRKTRNGIIQEVKQQSEKCAKSGAWNTRLNGEPTIIDDGVNFTIIWPLERTKPYMWPVVS